jgi:hypothetical protein
MYALSASPALSISPTLLPCPVVPMEITFLDNGGNIFVLDEFIDQMNSYI